MESNNKCIRPKYIYVAFLTSPTRVGKVIRKVTKNKYSHAVLSFKEDLGTMYSFARYYINTPLVAGFVEESVLRYHYLSGDEIPVKVCGIPVSEEKYAEVQKMLEAVQTFSDQYVYNLFSLLFAVMHKKCTIEKSYTCVEFVYSILYQCGIETSIDINKYFEIKDLEKALEKYIVFEGNLPKPTDPNDWGNDRFYVREGLRKSIPQSLKRCGILIKRSFAG